MDNIQAWIQLGFAGGFAVYLLTIAIPRSEKRADKRDASFLAALNRQHEEHFNEIARAEDHVERRHGEVKEEIGKVRERLRNLANVIAKDDRR